MKRLFLAAMALALSACTTTGTSISSIPAPATIAVHTAADEEVLKAGERLYKVTRTAGETLVDVGFLRGPLATRAAELDAKLYAGLKALRSAYATFNSADLLTASANLESTAAQVEALIKGDVR